MPTSFRLNGFRDMSIQRQYALILLLTVGSILLIVDVALIGIQWHMAHDQLLKQVHAEAKIIAVSVVASLSSNNHQTAENILHGVESETSIETAMLYDRNGEPFATYQRSGVSFPPHISVPLEYRYTFQDGYLNLFQPVGQWVQIWVFRSE